MGFQIVLEHKSLLLLPWSRTQPSPPACERPKGDLQKREILDPTSGSRLGQARWSSAEPRGLLRWLVTPNPVVAVHETEDDSLLFTMRGARRWRLRTRYRRGKENSDPESERFWEVREADEHIVGTVQPHRGGTSFPSLTLAGRSDSSNFLVAYDRAWRAFAVATSADRSESKIWAQSFGESSWTELGKLSRVGEGLVLDFSTLLEGQPFCKMLVLAEALIVKFA